MAENRADIFSRLQRLMNRGPIVRPIGGKLLKVKDIDQKSASWLHHGKTHRKVAYYIYQNLMQFDITRRSRYMEYEMMEQCVSGDTKIATPNGFVKIDELTRLDKKQYFPVYSCDSKGFIIGADAHYARKTQTNVPTFKIVFDDEKNLVATELHRIMMIDGSYKFLKDLKIGDKCKSRLNNQPPCIVKSIEPDIIQDVYCLTVPHYHNFATDSVIVKNSPEISTALDIYSDDSTTANDDGKSLTIFSEDKDVQEILENLFFDILNTEFRIYSWTRNLSKYGDFFLLLDISPEHGIIGTKEVPPIDIEREEGYDKDNPDAYRFKIHSLGETIFQNYEIAHFRMVTDTMYLPYGKSMLEGARRIWKQLVLMEDAMLVYRITRAPERRVFKIDVGGIAPKDIPLYIEKVKNELKRTPVIDFSTGRMDLKYNPETVTEDYYIPIRGDKSSSIETLPGGSNINDIEDVQYLQSKLIASLKIPKSYLSYEADLAGKATLSQEDIRFSRTVERIQRTIESELSKIAVIHLYINGFEDEKLVDFEIHMTNPSTIAEQLKLDLMDKRTSTATNLVQSGLFSTQWIRENIYKMSAEEMELIDKQLMLDKKFNAKAQQLEAGPMVGGGLGGGEGEEGMVGSVEDLPSAGETEGGEEETQEEGTPDVYDLTTTKDLRGGFTPGDNLIRKPGQKRMPINRKTLLAQPKFRSNPMGLETVLRSIDKKLENINKQVRKSRRNQLL